MQDYLHLFESQSAFSSAYTGEEYHEPWVSYTMETSAVTYNKKHLDLVDLGLPSGTLWATKNIGAATTADTGYLYAWGEITPKTAFTNENYRFYVGENQEYSKYNSTDGKELLDLEDDAAAVEYFGTGAHIPSVAQLNELLDNTTISPNYDDGNQYVTSITLTSNINQETLTFLVTPTKIHQTSDAYNTTLFWLNDACYPIVANSDHAFATIFTGEYFRVETTTVMYRFGCNNLNPQYSSYFGVPIRPVVGNDPEPTS